MSPRTDKSASLKRRVAAAPISWGVWDARSRVDRSALVESIATCGYSGLELGPAGFFKPSWLRDQLYSCGLELVGAFVDLPLTDSTAKGACLDRVAALLNELDRATPAGSRSPLVVLSDAYDAQGDLGASGDLDGESNRIDQVGWRALVDTSTAIAEHCAGRGYQLAFHPHAGSHVEAPREIDLLLARLDPALVGLCLDTGHAYFGGDDPVRLLQMYSDRIGLIHLKDVNLAVLSALRKSRFSLAEAWRHGLFCALGSGGVDLESFLQVLAASGNDSWIVVEQDRVLDPSSSFEQIHRAERDNRRFLANRGL